MNRRATRTSTRTTHRLLARAGGAVLVALALWGRSPAAAPAEDTSHLFVVRWTSRPDQDLLSGSAYSAWSRTAIARCLAVPGVTGLSTYRAAAGEPHIMTMFEFPTFVALAGWRGSPELEALTEEARQFTYETVTEVWGPSPYPSVTGAAAPGPAGAAGHVLYVLAWNVFPGKHDAYARWIPGAMRTWAAGPGITSVRAHRVVVGTRTDVITCEFPDFQAWARWYESADIQRTRVESRELIMDARTELWGPNPLLPARLANPGAAGR